MRGYLVLRGLWRRLFAGNDDGLLTVQEAYRLVRRHLPPDWHAEGYVVDYDNMYLFNMQPEGERVYGSHFAVDKRTGTVSDYAIVNELKEIHRAIRRHPIRASDL